MSEKTKIQILSDNENAIFEEREEGLTHSPFSLDLDLYHSIQAGDSEALERAINAYLNSGLVIGHMTSDKLREIHYWAVATISLAIHYAILGGLDETDAYNLSDIYIRYIDKTKSFDECISYLHDKAMELAKAVSNAGIGSRYSSKVKACIHYIHVHLHDRLEIADIAKELGLTRDYLSTLFASELGISLHKYILKEKTGEAARLLLQNKTIHEIAYTLSFCSESHFINCFKKIYGITPGKYRSRN